MTCRETDIMNNSLFRKKSLDKVKSPENLDDYIRVSNPGVWLLLISVIILLAGACVWGIFGHVDSTVDVVVRAENGILTATVCDVDVSEGMTLKIAGRECAVENVSYDSDTSGKICVATSRTDIPDGVYDAVIVIKRFRPVSFILN